MKATIYHNPRCSKSTQALKLLEERNIDLTIVDYLENPPSKQAIKDILVMLGSSADSFIRKKELLYKELKLKDATGIQLVQAMAKHPILIERPIVISHGKAVVGRPPEKVLELLQE